MEISENNKPFSDKEILDYLSTELIREKSVKSLSQKFQIKEYQILGYLHQLRKKGINIDYYEKNGDAFLILNNHPDLSKENSYRIQENVDDITKFAVISDLRFGSKYEQIAILNDMYRKFAKNGIKYVFITGNLLEGPYTGKQSFEFGKSLFYNDAISQANHFINYFPHVDSIKTLFITGTLDHKWAKKLQVGEYIAKNRKDLIYLGPKSCNVYFNNVIIRFEQLKNGNAYTLSYPAQKYSRSMSSYEDYDAIFLGGGLNFQHFPMIRDTQIFSVPSVVDRTPKMASDNQNNTIGAIEIDLSYTKTGKMKHLVPMFIPYPYPSKEDFFNIRKLNLVDEDNKKANIESHKDNTCSWYFENIDKFYKFLHKEESFDEILNKYNLTNNELMGIIEYLQKRGREIDIVDKNGELVVCKRYVRKKEYKMKPPMEELNKKELGIVSDTHYGSIWSQPSMVKTFAYEAYNRGITDMLHIGDITDGDYSRIRPNHVHEVFLYGATGQMEYVVNTLPKYKGMTWHAITGSHDQTHLFNYGMDIGAEIAKRRKDFDYLGQDRAIYMIDNCKIELFHPGGGTSRILSTKPQNGIDQMPSLAKPNLSLRGHYHKVYSMVYRGIPVLLCPCNVDQSSFMMKQEIPNLMGNYFLTIYYDDTGYIHYLIPEPMLFDINDVRKNDWERPTRSLKHRVLKR